MTICLTIWFQVESAHSTLRSLAIMETGIQASPMSRRGLTRAAALWYSRRQMEWDPVRPSRLISLHIRFWLIFVSVLGDGSLYAGLLDPAVHPLSQGNDGRHKNDRSTTIRRSYLHATFMPEPIGDPEGYLQANVASWSVARARFQNTKGHPDDVGEW